MAWFILGVTIWAILMYLVTPLIKKTSGPIQDTDEIITYRAEIARLEAQAVDDPELEARKIDLQRQLLTLTDQTQDTSAPNILVINSVFAFFVFGAVGLYALIGSPELTKPGVLQMAATVATPQNPTAQTPMDPDEREAEIESLLAELTQQLSGEQKDDPRGWLIYARTLMNLGRFDEAFSAYEELIEVSNQDSSAISEYERAQAYAAEILNPPERPSSLGVGPTQADIESAAGMSAQDRSAMITGMVEGLAARLADDPNDPDGWARLLRARKVLGQTGQIAQDMNTVKTQFNDQPDVLAAILEDAGLQ